MVPSLCEKGVKSNRVKTRRGDKKKKIPRLPKRKKEKPTHNGSHREGFAKISKTCKRRQLGKKN